MYPAVSADNLTEFERIAGPIPRFVLEGPSTKLSFTEARKELEKSTLRLASSISLENINRADIKRLDVEALYSVLQIEVSSTTFKKIGIRWASPLVEEKILSRMLQFDLNDLWTRYRYTPGSINGSFYEIWAHRVLAKRGRTPVSMRSLKDGNTTEDRIGERTLLLERTYEQMKNMDETTYGVPASRSFPAIDAVCLPYFLQITTQPSHSIMLKPFATFVHEMIRLKKVEKDADIKLVFVVPPAVFDDYTRCVRGLTTHWQSPCLVVRCSEQGYTLDGKTEHTSTTAMKALRTEKKELAKAENQATNTAKRAEAERRAIKHALDILPRIKQYVMVLKP
jgi:hypothetical protein